MKIFKLFSILVFALALISCGKDDDDEIAVGEIKGAEVSESQGAFQLLWDAFDGAKEYYVFVNGKKTSDIPYTSTQARITELAKGDVIEIKAYSDFEENNLIASIKITYGESSSDTDKDGDKDSIVAPSSPTEVSVTDLKGNSATVTFTFNGKCDGIYIYTEAKTDELEPLVKINNVVEGENSVTIDDLEAGTEYTLFLYAYNQDDEKLLFSEEAKVAFTTEKGSPIMQISNSGYYKQNGGGLFLTLSVVAEDLFSEKSQLTEAGDLTLNLYISSSKDGEFELCTTERLYAVWGWPQAQQIIAFSLKLNWDYVIGETYYLQAKAKNENGEIIGQTEVHEIFYKDPSANDIIPGKPSNVTLSKDGNEVTISWSKAENATKYNVYVSTSDNMSLESLVGTTTSTSLVDTDRATNVKMYYRVVSVSSTGNKAFSTVESIWW